MATEQRFTLICDDDLVLYDFIEDNGKVIHTLKVVDLLNDLNDENEQFRNIARDYNIPFENLCNAFTEMLNCDCATDCKNVVENYKKENEQLKSALLELKEIGDYQAMRIKELDNENEQLKQTIQEAYNNERTSLGRSVLKQLLEAIE